MINGITEILWSQFKTFFFINTNPTGKSSKFSTVEKVIKALLSLSHCNADVERGFPL